MSGDRDIDRWLSALETRELTRRDFLHIGAAAGFGGAAAGRLLGAGASSARAPIRQGTGSGARPSHRIPPVDWLSHPPYRELPSPSARPFDETSRDYYLAPDGSDRTGNGSQARPWRSWARAQTVAAPGDTLYMRGGIYFMLDRATWSKSGTTRNPITIRAYPGELPIVTTAYPAFALDPHGAWEPVPAAQGGAAFEFRSRERFPLLSPIVTGRFVDSYYPLFAYSRESDFRSENEFRLEGLQNRADHPAGFWAGPGAWWSGIDQRIHVRLKHTSRSWLDGEDYLGIGEGFVTNNYQGETDPRELPLLLTAACGTPTMTTLDARHVRVLDIVFAGGCNLHVAGSSLLFDNIWSCTGQGPALLSYASDTRYTNCRFRGVEAPWNNRFTSKDRSESAYTVHLAGGTDLEVDHCEITDGHDAVLCSNATPQNLAFHHNLLERNSDDGLFLPPKQASRKWIYQNIFRMNLSHLPFRDGTPHAERSGDGTFICRNLFDMRPRTPGGPRDAENVRPSEYYDGYNLRMEHADIVLYPGLYFYHNTVLARESKRTYCQGITEKYQDSIRRVFNNIFVQADRRPSQTVPTMAGDLKFGFNLQWSFSMGSSGSWPGDVHADPRFWRWSPDWREPHDVHLKPDSPGRGAGTPLPVEWFDPLRDLDEKHDLGAIPYGLEGEVFGPHAAY